MLNEQVAAYAGRPAGEYTLTYVLVVGAAGMLGNAAFRLFSASDGFQVTGTVRGSKPAKLVETTNARLVTDIIATDQDRLVRLLGIFGPTW